MLIFYFLISVLAVALFSVLRGKNLNTFQFYLFSPDAFIVLFVLDIYTHNINITIQRLQDASSFFYILHNTISWNREYLYGIKFLQRNMDTSSQASPYTLHLPKSLRSVRLVLPDESEGRALTPNTLAGANSANHPRRAGRDSKNWNLNLQSNGGPPGTGRSVYTKTARPRVTTRMGTKGAVVGSDFQHSARRQEACNRAGCHDSTGPGRPPASTELARPQRPSVQPRSGRSVPSPQQALAGRVKHCSSAAMQHADSDGDDKPAGTVTRRTRPTSYIAQGMTRMGGPGPGPLEWRAAALVLKQRRPATHATYTGLAPAAQLCSQGHRSWPTDSHEPSRFGSRPPTGPGAAGPEERQ